MTGLTDVAAVVAAVTVTAAALVGVGAALALSSWAVL